jgi:hypothetical protein
MAKKTQTTGYDNITAELIKADGRDPSTIIYVWNKDKLTEEWQEIDNFTYLYKGNKTECSNCIGK